MRAGATLPAKPELFLIDLDERPFTIACASRGGEF